MIQYRQTKQKLFIYFTHKHTHTHTHTHYTREREREREREIQTRSCCSEAFSSSSDFFCVAKIATLASRLVWFSSTSLCCSTCDQTITMYQMMVKMLEQIQENALINKTKNRETITHKRFRRFVFFFTLWRIFLPSQCEDIPNSHCVKHTHTHNTHTHTHTHTHSDRDRGWGWGRREKGWMHWH